MCRCELAWKVPAGPLVQHTPVTEGGVVLQLQNLCRAAR